MDKPKVAFFDFTSCEGCQVEITNLDQQLLNLLEAVDIVEFREIMKETTSDPLDIAFIEGSFSRDQDLPGLKNIRQRAKIVIAYGSCAATGGINALKNHKPDYQYKMEVYGADASMPHLETHKALPISAAVKVDYSIPGCPINRDEFVRVVSDLLHGKEPYLPNYAVCIECKKKENLCRFDNREVCLGPIARAGCGAICPSNNVPCEACRGFVDTPNYASMIEVMVNSGLKKEYALTKARMFSANILDNNLSPK